MSTDTPGQPLAVVLHARQRHIARHRGRPRLAHRAAAQYSPGVQTIPCRSPGFRARATFLAPAGAPIHTRGLTAALRVGLILLLSVAVAGCPRNKRRTITPEVPTTGEPEARKRFEQARADFEREEDRASAGFEAIVDDFPDDPIVPWALLYAGMSAVQEGRYDQALTSLETLDEQDDVDVRLRRRGRFFLGLARVYTGQHDKARRLLEKSEDVLDGDDERAEWTAAMAEVLGRGNRPLESALYYDDWYKVASGAEKVYIVSRLRALASAADRDAVTRAYRSLDRSSGPATAILGARVADELAATGNTEEAREVRRNARAIAEKLAISDIAASAASAGDPGVLGAILPLSGRRAQAGDFALSGLALASGTFGDGGVRAGDTNDDNDDNGDDDDNDDDADRGKGYRVVMQDSASTIVQAQEAVDITAGEGAIAIVGPIDGKSVDAAASRAQAAGVPLISLNPRSDRRASTASPLIFHIVQSAESRAEALARHAHDRGLRTFAILRPDSGYGRAVGAAFQAEARRLGAEVVAEETYDRKATSFTGPINKLARAKWEAVFIPEQAAKLELIAPALAAADLLSRPVDDDRKVRRGRKIVLLSTAEFIAPKYLRSSARYSHGAIFAPGFYPDRDDAVIGAYATRYEQSFGREPTALDAYAHDAALVVRAAVESGAASRPEVAARMASSRVTGLTGSISFDETRRRSDPGLLFTVVSEDDRWAIRAMR